MNYSILIYETSANFIARTDTEQQEGYWAKWPPYKQALVDAGVFVNAVGLQLPETATTVHIRDGQRMVQDGPYADTKEQLGGIFVINTENLDCALEWAARCPVGPGGYVEVRPNMGTCS